MSILFILKSFDMGGVEVVTTVLANKFAAEGHNVSIFAFNDAEHDIIDRLDKRVHTYTMHKLAVTEENVYAMRAVMLEEHVNVVINQLGLPFAPLKVARKAAKGLDIKFISVYHSTPEMNGRIQSVLQQMESCHSTLKRIVLNIKYRIFKAITAKGMRYNYDQSDLFMVLSPSFIDKFKSFTGIRNPVKLCVQTNPITIDSKGFKLKFEKKKKEIIFVGRIDYSSKRLYRVIDAWTLLENNFIDWRLTIVGMGPDMEDMQRRVQKMNLSRVFFEGFQQPKPYYERASILVLTSEFEGFPLVLAECMSFGVVPVVYNSYAAAGDIISDGVNGRLLNKANGEFPTVVFADALHELMTNNSERIQMAKNAMKTAVEGYGIDAIYEQWMTVIKELISN